MEQDECDSAVLCILDIPQDPDIVDAGASDSSQSSPENTNVTQAAHAAPALRQEAPAAPANCAQNVGDFTGMQKLLEAHTMLLHAHSSALSGRTAAQPVPVARAADPAHVAGAQQHRNPADVKFTDVDPWVLQAGWVDQSAYPTPEISIRKRVLEHTGPAKRLVNSANPFRNKKSKASQFKLEAFGAWLPARFVKVNKDTAAHHVRSLQEFLGLFKSNCDEQNLVHFFRGLAKTKLLATLFTLPVWNESCTWTRKHLKAVNYFVRFLKQNCFENRRSEWMSELAYFLENQLPALEGKCFVDATIRSKVKNTTDFRRFKHMPSEEEMKIATHQAYCVFNKLCEHVGDRVPTYLERACANMLTVGPLQINDFMGRVKEWSECTRKDFEEQLIEEKQTWMALAKQKTILSQGVAGKDVCDGNNTMLMKYFRLAVPAQHQRGDDTRLFIPAGNKATKCSLDSLLKSFSKVFLGGKLVNTNLMRKRIETFNDELDRQTKQALGGKTRQEKAANANAHDPRKTGKRIYVCGDAEKKARDGAESFELVFGERVPWPSDEELAACDVDIEAFIKKNKTAITFNVNDSFCRRAALLASRKRKATRSEAEANADAQIGGDQDNISLPTDKHTGIAATSGASDSAALPQGSVAAEQQPAKRMRLPTDTIGTRIEASMRTLSEDIHDTSGHRTTLAERQEVYDHLKTLPEKDAPRLLATWASDFEAQNARKIDNSAANTGAPASQQNLPAAQNSGGAAAANVSKRSGSILDTVAPKRNPTIIVHASPPKTKQLTLDESLPDLSQKCAFGRYQLTNDDKRFIIAEAVAAGCRDTFLTLSVATDIVKKGLDEKKWNDVYRPSSKGIASYFRRGINGLEPQFKSMLAEESNRHAAASAASGAAGIADTEAQQRAC